MQYRRLFTFTPSELILATRRNMGFNVLRASDVISRHVETICIMWGFTFSEQLNAYQNMEESFAICGVCASSHQESYELIAIYGVFGLNNIQSYVKKNMSYL